ncbi:MAG: LacI family DNA-binding transcriptional regulator [Desulfobacterales bacterium]
MVPKLTMQEIARLAGVSLATVSRAVHNPELLRPHTRQRILQVMAEHNYVYNAAAGDLSRQRSTVIGVTVPTNRNPIFAASTFAIEEQAQEMGYSILLANTQYSPEVESQLLQGFLERRVAGIILTGFSIDRKAQVQDLVDAGIHCLVIWEQLKDSGLSYVGFDNHGAARAMTAHLAGLGHRRIGLIIGPYSKLGRVQKRLDGYRSALREAGIGFDPELVLENAPVLEDGKESMHHLMSLDDPPTAVFAASDILAIGALSAAKEMGLNVPADVSIAGFDDNDFAAYCDPPLTTVRVPSHEIGRLAARHLIETIESGAAQIRQYSLRTDLIVRGSCAPPRARQNTSG